jgi:hypothetical protein
MAVPFLRIDGPHVRPGIATDAVSSQFPREIFAANAADQHPDLT